MSSYVISGMVSGRVVVHSSMIPVVESATVVVTGVVGLTGMAEEEVVSAVEVLAVDVVRTAVV